MPILVSSDPLILSGEERSSVQRPEETNDSSRPIPAFGQIPEPAQWPSTFPPVNWYPWLAQYPFEPAPFMTGPIEESGQTNPSQGPGYVPGQGTNPYPNFQLGYMPLVFSVGGGGRPEPGEPLTHHRRTAPNYASSPSNSLDKGTTPHGLGIFGVLL